MIKDLWLVITGQLSSIKQREEQLTMNSVRAELGLLRLQYSKEITVISIAVGRLVAKLDPNYAFDELDPARKKAPDKIGEDVINKLFAESIARRKMEGKQ